MIKSFVSNVVSVALFVASSAAVAGPDEDLRDAALAEATKLRGEGWPIERCYTGARFYNNILVEGNGTILAGDKLLYINATSLENATTDEVGKALGSIPPNERITLQVDRNGKVLNLEQQCGNLADVQRPYLLALDLAGKKKWYECIDMLADQSNDSLFLDLRARCAKVSRKANEYPIQEWVDKSMRNGIAMGAYAKDSRVELAKALLKARFDTSITTYTKLTADVKAWDEGKTWGQIQPNYAAMKQAAERGVKARLVDPQSAVIEMPYDFIYGAWTPAFTGNRFEGFMTCGTVNAKNRMGGYTGSTFFISVIDETGFEKYTDMDSTTSEYLRPVDNGCAQLVKKLNYIGDTNSSSTENKSQASNGPSMAQELEKLADLYAKGALSNDEYATAKARVLAGETPK